MQRRRLQEKESLDSFIWDPARGAQYFNEGAEPGSEIDPNTRHVPPSYTTNDTSAELAHAVDNAGDPTNAGSPVFIGESTQTSSRYDPPFTPSQFRDTCIALVLSQLLEKYSNERSLAPIIVGYMDDVQRRVQDQLGGLEGSQQFLKVDSQETQLVDGRHFVGSLTPQHYCRATCSKFEHNVKYAMWQYSTM